MVADISKISMPNGTIYNLMDSAVRSRVTNLENTAALVGTSEDSSEANTIYGIRKYINTMIGDLESSLASI